MIANDNHECTTHFHYIIKIVIIIVVIIEYLCAITSEMTLNISLLGTNSNTILGHFLP